MRLAYHLRYGVQRKGFRAVPDFDTSRHLGCENPVDISQHIPRFHKFSDGMLSTYVYPGDDHAFHADICISRRCSALDEHQRSTEFVEWRDLIFTDRLVSRMVCCCTGLQHRLYMLKGTQQQLLILLFKITLSKTLHTLRQVKP